jgi:hypothetical protein
MTTRRLEKPSGVDNAVTNRITDQIGQGIEAEFSHYRGTMGFTGPDADSESGRNLLIAFSLAEKPDDFSLSWG